MGTRGVTVAVLRDKFSDEVTPLQSLVKKLGTGLAHWRRRWDLSLAVGRKCAEGEVAALDPMPACVDNDLDRRCDQLSTPLSHSM